MAVTVSLPLRPWSPQVVQQSTPILTLANLVSIFPEDEEMRRLQKCSETSTGPFGRGQPALSRQDRRLDVVDIDTAIDQSYLGFITEMGRLRGEVSQDTIQSLSDEIALHTLGFCSTREIDYSNLPDQLDIQSKDYGAKRIPKPQVRQASDLVEKKDTSKNVDGMVFPAALSTSKALNAPHENSPVTSLTQRSDSNAIPAKPSSEGCENSIEQPKSLALQSKQIMVSNSDLAGQVPQHSMAISQARAGPQSLGYHEEEEKDDMKTPTLEPSNSDDTPSPILLIPEPYNHQLEKRITAHENFSQISLLQVWEGGIASHENFSQISLSRVWEGLEHENLELTVDADPMSDSKNEQGTACHLATSVLSSPAKHVISPRTSPSNATGPPSHNQTELTKPRGRKIALDVEKTNDPNISSVFPLSTPAAKPKAVSFAATATIIPNNKSGEASQETTHMRQITEDMAHCNVHDPAVRSPNIQQNVSPASTSTKAPRRRVLSRPKPTSINTLRSDSESDKAEDMIIKNLQPTHVRAMKALLATPFTPEPKNKDKDKEPNWQVFRPLPLTYDGRNRPLRKLEDFPDPGRMLANRAMGIIQATRRVLGEQEPRVTKAREQPVSQEIDVEESKWNPPKRLRKMRSDCITDRSKEKDSFFRPSKIRRKMSAGKIGEKKAISQEFEQQQNKVPKKPSLIPQFNRQNPTTLAMQATRKFYELIKQPND